MMSSKRKKRFRNLLVVVALVACGKLVYNFITMVDTSAIENNNGGKVQCIGHGGNGVQSIFPFQSLPCNTETSIRRSLDAGVDGLELDVQITADSVLVLYHDQRLEDATGLSGCIGHSLWDDIKGTKFSIGAPFDWFQDEVLISFEKGLDILLEEDEFPIVHIDFHAINFCEDDKLIQLNQFCRALDELLLRKEIPSDKIFVVGTHEIIMRACMKMESNPGLIYEESDDLSIGIAMAQKLGIKHIQAHVELLTKENVKQAHDAGLFVVTHRGKTRWGLAKRIELNVDAIQTDGIAVMLDLLD